MLAFEPDTALEPEASEQTPAPVSRMRVVTVRPPAVSASEDADLRVARDLDFERRMLELLEQGEP